VNYAASGWLLFQGQELGLYTNLDITRETPSSPSISLKVMIERELIHRWYELGVTAKRFLDFTCHLLDCMENDILREVERKVAIGGIFEKILAFDLLIKGFWTLPRTRASNRGDKYRSNSSRYAGEVRIQEAAAGECRIRCRNLCSLSNIGCQYFWFVQTGSPKEQYFRNIDKVPCWSDLRFAQIMDNRYQFFYSDHWTSFKSKRRL
jgi:hypothetical protein